VELLIAQVAPRPDVPASVRKLPAPKAAPAPATGLPLEPAGAAPARPPSKAYVGRDGRRCTARSGLEYGHLHAHALGGPMTPDNLALRCRAHNAFEAEQCFGPWRGKRAVRERPPPYGVRIIQHTPARPFRNGCAAGP
jgi:hypothetical protein